MSKKPKFRVGQVVWNKCLKRYVRITKISSWCIEDGVEVYIDARIPRPTHHSSLRNLRPLTKRERGAA